MAQWMVKLAGNEVDLKALSTLYTESACRVAKDNESAYHLTRTEFAKITKSAEVDRAARKGLAIINADMRLRDVNYQPVSLECVTMINDDGSRTNTISISATVALSSSAGLRVGGIVLGSDG